MLTAFLEKRFGDEKMSRFKLPVVTGFRWYKCLSCGFLFFRLVEGRDSVCPVCGSNRVKRVNGGGF